LGFVLRPFIINLASQLFEALKSVRFQSSAYILAGALIMDLLVIFTSYICDICNHLHIQLSVSLALPAANLVKFSFLFKIPSTCSVQTHRIVQPDAFGSNVTITNMEKFYYIL